MGHQYTLITIKEETTQEIFLSQCTQITTVLAMALVTESDTILSLTSKATTRHHLHLLQLLVQKGDSKTHRIQEICLELSMDGRNRLLSNKKQTPKKPSDFVTTTNYDDPWRVKWTTR